MNHMLYDGHGNYSPADDDDFDILMDDDDDLDYDRHRDNRDDD